MTRVCITGASRGIGLALCEAFTKRGDKVDALCRVASPQLRALPVKVVEGLDVGDETTYGCLKQLGSGEPIDVLINNAGILRRDGLEPLDPNSILEQFQINALAPLRITEALLPRLRAGSKIANITSRMGSIADNSSGGSYGYRMSKVALNAATVSMAHDLRPRGIAVCVLHPGFVRTDMTGGTGQVSPTESAAGLMARIDALTLEQSGGFWHMNGERLPW